MPEAASSDPALEAAPSVRGRLSTKFRLVVAAAALSVMTLAAGATAWLWPKAAPASRQRPVAAAASAVSAAVAPKQLVPAAVAASAAATEPSAERVATPVGKPDLVAAEAVEDPLDQLRRRLDQKLGAHGMHSDSTSGELHLVARTIDAKPGTTTASAAPIGDVHWSYGSRNGPQAWGRLDTRFGACATGRRQSPIDIRDGVAVDLEAPNFSYKASTFTVVDNGHTVQVNVAAGNYFELHGKRWQLRQFHFHRPSEERIDGKQFDMAVHLVHADDAGHMAVVAVLLQRGAAQPLLRAVWNDLPLEKNDEVQGRTTIDLNQLLPTNRRYYTYMGSLTTPPCSEGVLWMVLREPVAVAASDIGIFARLYPMNARPVQNANGRLIKQSE